MRSLVFTGGSPFARAIRVILDELALPYHGEQIDVAPTVEQIGQLTPTMQVPTLRDGNLMLWESGTIAEYLLAQYPSRPANAIPLAAATWRSDHPWEDKLVFSTIQTFGTAATTISQLTWTGIRLEDNPHLQRCEQRMIHILDWLEDQILPGQTGFFPHCISVQDIFLACYIGFVQARPLGVDLTLSRHVKIAHLVEQLEQRPSFRSNPIWWWDPDVTGYHADGTPIYQAKSS